jgi:hypothetical protein
MEVFCDDAIKSPLKDEVYAPGGSKFSARY